MALISAHRFLRRSPTPSVATLRALTVDFVEIDLQLLGDGSVVLWHDARIDGIDLAELSLSEFEARAGTVPTWDAVLAAVPEGLGLHLDLKFVPDPSMTSRAEIEIARRAVDVVGAERVFVTSLEDDSVAVLTAWATVHAPGMKVGLALGRGFGDLRWRDLPRLLRAELFPLRRLRATGATAVAVQHRLARLTVARLALRTGLPLAVWTVDSPRALRYWGSRAWLVVTNVEDLASDLFGRQRSDG